MTRNTLTLLKRIYSLVLFSLLVSCGEPGKPLAEDGEGAVSCSIPSRFPAAKAASAGASVPDEAGMTGDSAVAGMVYIPGGTFSMGGDNDQADKDEYPKHTVTLDPYWIDEHEVTNAQFSRFVEATGYITTAERKPDWEEMKKQLPPGTPKPDESLLVPASLVFVAPKQEVPLNDPSAWWVWMPGANWKQPEGPGSTINDRQHYPVVHVSWEDALAYCRWAGKQLPTEAQWEFAARGGLKNNIYPWGNQHISSGKPKANYWEGKFPNRNSGTDGFVGAAPVKTYDPNGYGLYDMSGNVWEWCQDLYHFEYYQQVSQVKNLHNPTGPEQSYDPREPHAPKRVIRGGSYLCNDSYCSGYRVARRMKTTGDSGMGHLGFRCVKAVAKVQ